MQSKCCLGDKSNHKNIYVHVYIYIYICRLCIDKLFNSLCSNISFLSCLQEVFYCKKPCSRIVYLAPLSAAIFGFLMFASA